MLTRRVATPSTPEITLKKLERLTPRNTERNSIARKPRHLGGVRLGLPTIKRSLLVLSGGQQEEPSQTSAKSAGNSPLEEHPLQLKDFEYVKSVATGSAG
jgi:hypothetical protein